MDRFRLTKEHIFIGYIRTLESFSTALLKEDDYVISSRIFDDMEIYMRTYLCEENLEIFVRECWIDEETAGKSRELRDTFFSLQKENPQLWNLESVKTAEEWKFLMELSEDIRKERIMSPIWSKIMSHSKHTKRGFSLYIEKWNASAKKFINTCVLCGKNGYSPSVEQAEFKDKVTARELMKTLPRMELDCFGRCTECAEIQDINCK